MLQIFSVRTTINTRQGRISASQGQKNLMDQELETFSGQPATFAGQYYHTILSHNIIAQYYRAILSRVGRRDSELTLTLSLLNNMIPVLWKLVIPDTAH